MDLHATRAVSFIGRGQARIMEVGPARLGSYFGGASVSTARAACPLSASAAVTAVTGYSSNSPLFFGRADLRVTVSTRIVLVMTLHTRCAVASPGRRFESPTVGALTRSAPCLAPYLGNLLRDPNWLFGSGLCRCWLGYHGRSGERLRNIDGFRAGLMSTNYEGSP